MRFPIFIPLVLCAIFSIMMLISSFVVGPTWKFWLSLICSVAFSILSIVAGGALLRDAEVEQHH